MPETRPWLVFYAPNYTDRFLRESLGLGPRGLLPIRSEMPSALDFASSSSEGQSACWRQGAAPVRGEHTARASAKAELFTAVLWLARGAVFVSCGPRAHRTMPRDGGKVVFPLLPSPTPGSLFAPAAGSEWPDSHRWRRQRPSLTGWTRARDFRNGTGRGKASPPFFRRTIARASTAP